MTHKVKIYTTPVCTYCHMTKEFFKENNIKYTEIDVASDQKAAQEMIKKTRQAGVPVIEIDDSTIIIGFNKKKLEKELGIKSA